MTPLAETLKLVTRMLERHHIPYAIMGGLAVRVHGLPRPTYDVDLTLALSRDRLPDLYDEMEGLGFSVPSQYRSGWVDQIAGLPLVKFRWYTGERDVDVDCFLSESPYQESLLARRKLQKVDDWECFVVSVEDLILLKLIARRPRDLVDIGDVLLVQGTLDEAYMRRWAADLGVVDSLEDVLKQA